MKNYLLFNQLFGTVGSPNQTGETLTRENRIGLMSYLRRTLMLLFAVLVMSMANIGMAWGATKTITFSGPTSTCSAGENITLSATTNITESVTLSTGISFTNSGYALSATSGDNKSCTYSSTSYKIPQLYSTGGTKSNWSLAGAISQYVDITLPAGSSFTLSSIAWALDAQSTAFTAYIGVSGGLISYKSASLSVSNSTSATTGTLSSLNQSWVGGTTYRLYVETTGPANTGKYFGICKLVLTGEYSAPAASEWQVKGLDDDKWAGFNMTGTGTVSVSRSLEAKHEYDFKLYNTSTSKWWGNGTTYKMTRGETIVQADAGANCKLRTSKAGTYTFSFNTSTKELTVTYPDDYKGYWTKNGASWSKVYAYCYMDGDDSWRNADWPGVEITSQTEDICGTHYYINTSGYTTVIFNNGSSGVGNQTGNIAISGGEGKHAVGAAATGWTAYPTYTISYNNGGGSGSMSSQSSIACSTDQATTANTFTRSGYNFTGWHANVDVTVGGATKTAGTLLADGVTIQDISSNITLTAQWEEVVTLYTVTYNVNGGGTVTPTSATQASSGASVTLPTPTWSGYTFEGWYNAGTKIGVGGASYTPTADITLYAHWTDNISGKVFSFIDNNYGDKFKSFTGYGWVAKDSTGRSKTFTNASTGVEYRISAAGWDIKNNAISALAKFLGGTSSMSIVIPTGKIATVKISYNAYGTGDDFRLTVNSTAQANPSTKLANDMTNAQVIASMKEITLSSQTGTLTLGISNTGKNNYIGRVSAVITGYTVSYAAGTYGSGSLASGTKTAGSSFTLSSSSSAFTRSGYVYDGWSVNADGSTKDYNLGGSYTTDAAITLYPHWVADCVAPTTVNVTATVNEVSGFWFYPDDDVVLTAAPTGSPAGTPVTYQWKKNGADIDGATSSTYTIDDAAASDAGKYTCTISYGACSTTSAEFELKCMQFYLKNSSGEDISNHALTKVDATHATLSLSLTGGTTYKFRVTDGCNNWYGNSDETGMTSSNCSNWTMPHDADCKVTTSSKSATYTFNFDFSAGLLGSEMKVSVVYPAGDQAAGKVIYWDNNVLNWASAPWYRIGKGTHNNKTQMTLVPGTANLYKITTTEYNGFEYWHIANNEGEGTSNIFWTKDSDPATNEAITAAMGFEGSPVTADAVTFTPTSSHATGTSSNNDNCEFYEYGQQNGMKTDRVTISDYSNGTITVNYTNTSNVASTLTSGYADLAHTVVLTSITAEADDGYDASAVTINGNAYAANYVVTGNTTIAASFTLKTYTISYNKGTNGTGSKASETKTHGVNFTLPGSTFTYGGHTQDGWSTSDGGALAYALSGSYTTNAAQEFFPHWKCNTPEISCSSNTITISVPTGATVYYTTTTDGSDPADPTSSSTAYNPSSKPTISADTKIKAIAIQSGCTNSAIASASLTYVAAGTSYYLFTPTSAPNPVHTGTLKGDFITDKSVGDGTAQTIDGNEFSKKSITIAGSTLSGSISGKKAGNYSIDYDVKTTSTTFYVYVSGANTSIYMHKIRESGYTTDSIVSQSTGASTGVKLTFTLKSKENTRVCFSTGSTSVRCYQIVAVESGDALPQACDEGYELNFNSGRYAYLAGSSNQMTGSIDGLDICSYNSYLYKNSTSLELTKNSSNTYISFTTGASACAVKVTFSGGTLILNTSKSTSGGVGLTSNTAANLSASTTYYIINTNTTNRALITKIAFEETAAATYTLTNTVSPSGYGTVSHASVSSIPSGTSTSSSSNTYTVNGTTVTATPAATTAEYTYAFDSWSDLPATVAADAIVTANFTRSANSYTLAWSSNGGSELSGDYTSGSTAYGASITAPNDPTLSNYTFDGWKTNNDGTGTTAGATMPAAATTYYAAWKQTVTLKTGAQGSGADKTPTVVWQATSLNDFSAHTADGYTLQGYYTAGSGGVKVLNADGTFAAANVTDYITSSKWSRTGAAPTLFAQWVATEDCHTLKYAWKITGKFCDDGSTSVTASDTVRFPANASNLYFTVSGTGNTVSKGSSYNLGNTQNNYFLLTAKTGYQIKSICFYGKVQDSSVDYTTDGSSWSSLTSTNTSGDDYYSFSSINASAFGIKLTAATPEGVWIRNMVIEVCAAGVTTYSVTYDGNDETSGDVPTDASSPYTYGTTVTVLGNTGSLEKTSYTFAGWSTNNDGTGSSYVEDNTFSITGNTTLYAKWTQAVKLDKNGGSTDGSATAVWNATGLTGITHAKPAAGYKLLGYYSASPDGTKVLNSDGSFAATNVTGYITSGKWSRTSATTLYAEYESAGALTWNLIVNSDTTNLSTSTKTSAFTEISTTNMTNATLAGDLTYEKSKKSALTGKISTPASYDADDYVYVTFQVASGYKFTPSSIKVIAQPVTTGKDVKLSLTDGAYHSLVSSSATSISGGSTQTVTLAGDGTYFTGTVTLKIYCYGAADKYRLGTPITIEGEIEEACATMPSYKSMSYTTTTFAPGDDASGSPITIVGGTNIDTYQWKYNTVNDRTSGTNCGTGTSLTPLTDASATADGTRYYWCEMTNDACGITIKSPAVAITVAAAKSDATVAWTDPATPNYGGGGYTIKATVDQIGWDGNAADLVITAPAGIRIYNVTSGTDGNSRKYVQADFDVQTSFDRSTYASNIPFTVSAAATASYNAISNDHNVSYSACSGGGVGSSYKIRVRKNYDKDASNNYRWVTPGAGEITYAVGSSISSGKAGTAMAIDFDSIMSSDKQYIWVKTFVGNIKQMRLYVETSGANISVSALYQRTTYAAADAKDVITGYSVVYDEDDDAENTGTKGQHTIDLIFTSALSANDIICVKFSSSKVKALGAAITEGSAGSLNTHLQWSGGLTDGETVAKNTTDAYFTYSASKTTENTNTLGTITYSSSNTSVATVDATGKVALVAAGSTTIKATLAASGCYKKAEISYTLNVTEVACAITAGTLTLTSGTESKCSGDDVTLTLTGFESGAMLQWKDGDTDINNGGNYEIATDGTTSTLTTNQPGTYSVMVTSGCSVRSNRITISNKSTEVGAKRIVKNWYIKNGRLTPDIELWTLQNGAHLSSVAWDPANTTGLTASDFYESDGKVYLKGKEPSSNASGADIDYTLTLTVEDDCGSTTEMSASGQLIYLHHQKNTDKHVLAFVVTGTEKGGFTEGITAAQTTSVELYNTIAANFDVLATNVYSTDDEQALKEYYSQFDILCVTDYPNTGTKGVNKKSYVDALGALVDIRPILTMEAFVAKLANWKAKGISGTPQSPTTRQYSMLLQCKDHEIFAGTKLTKVGEGDETMYRVSMVDQTVEEYPTLDGYTPGSKDYNAGGKPALQGFTFTKEMLDDDLLPLGLIDDGSGNDLQVGIERQTEMEARLMVLGINSYAMERLTADGQTVVVNALKYLMKKNSEDIADCSNTFVGGDDEEDESTRYDWNVASHWSGNAVPDRTQKVRIVAPCVIKAGEKFHVTGVVIAPSGKYNHGANTANGSLTIAAGGALIVDGKVEAATAPLYTETRATAPADLTIGSTETNGNGTLIFDNEDGSTQAIVEYYSKATTNEAETWNWQYMAVPFNDNSSAYRNYYDSYLYRWAEDCSGWEEVPNRGEVYPWVGYTITQVGAKTYVMDGTLVETGEMEFTVPEGKNLVLGNSWTAPIQVKQFTDDDFANMSKNVYLFNTGYDKDGEGSFSGTRYEGGTYVTIPIHSSPYTGDSLISSLQAFIVYAKADEGGGTFTLDYDRHVRPARSTDKVNAGQMHAPQRGGVINDKPAVLKVWASGSRYDDRLVVLEREDFSTGLDEGWDGNKRVAGNSSPLIFAVTDNGREAVSAIPTMEGTLIGFWAGEDNEYTLHFEYNEEDELYLLDLDNNTYTPVNSNSTYVFTVPDKKAHNRFILTRNAPDPVATGVGETQANEKPEAKAIKFLKDEKVFIFVNGKLYDATGKIVK